MKIKLNEESSKQLKEMCLFNPYALNPPFPSSHLEVAKRMQPDVHNLADIDEIVEIGERMLEEWGQQECDRIEKQIKEEKAQESEKTPKNEAFEIEKIESKVLKRKYLAHKLRGKQSRLQERVFKGFNDVHLTRKFIINTMCLPEIRKISNFSEAFVSNKMREDYEKKLKFHAVEKRKMLNSRFYELYSMCMASKQERKVEYTPENFSLSENDNEEV